MTSSAFPLFGNVGGVSGGGGVGGVGGHGGKNKTYTGYASSVVSQQPMDGGTASAILPPRAGQSQFDRFANVVGAGGGVGGVGSVGKGRRLSIGSEAASASMYAYGYKAGEDDTQSIAPSQAGMTEF